MSTSPAPLNVHLWLQCGSMDQWSILNSHVFMITWLTEEQVRMSKSLITAREARGTITSFSPLTHPGRWQVTHTQITMPAQVLVSREKQESTLSHTSVHPAYPCSEFGGDPGLKLEAPLSLLREKHLPRTFLLRIELISGPSGGGQRWCSSCHPTAEVRDVLVLRALLNL